MHFTTRPSLSTWASRQLFFSTNKPSGWRENHVIIV